MREETPPDLRPALTSFHNLVIIKHLRRYQSETGHEEEDSKR
jgi:hypothetical protein